MAKMLDWEEIQEREEYKKLSLEDRAKIRRKWFQMQRGEGSQPSFMARVINAYKQDVAPTEAVVGLAKRALFPKAWPDGTPYSQGDYARADASARSEKLSAFSSPVPLTRNDIIADGVGSVLSQASDPTNIGLMLATRGASAVNAAAAGGLYEAANQYARDMHEYGSSRTRDVVGSGITGALISGGLDKVIPASSQIDSSIIGVARPAVMEAMESPVGDRVNPNVDNAANAITNSPGAQRLAEIKREAEARLMGIAQNINVVKKAHAKK
ncbi:MAG: hypothetical protein EOM21_14140 [Gammaproteobacteria bacterium]|nr:hypothetical protein [Gammaproteobacteria bacterium]